MKRPLKRTPAALLVLFGLMLLSAGGNAQEGGATAFVYTNDNNDNTPNTVSAFSVGPGGTLITVLGSPFMTGGTGRGLGFGSRRITATVTRNFLYVSNEGSNDIGAFSIDPTTGFLTPVSSMPFPTLGSGGSGISLAATPNGKFLYAGNFDSKNISAFRIGSDGRLTPVTSFPFPFNIGDSPVGMKVSPDGKFLGVALPAKDSVAMFKISSTGALGSVTGSPFSAGGSGPEQSMDLDISCRSNLLFDSKQASGTTVSVFTIDSKGALSLHPPFTSLSGSDSEVGVLSPDN